jgi:RNA polymerase-binding protein DksA
MSALTNQQLGRLKDKLKAQREEIREHIHEALLHEENESYADLAGRVRDIGDESIADLLSDINLAVISKHAADITGIEQALHRMGVGTYGTCVDCGDEIEYPRLDAYPTARRCVSCQARHEHTHSTAPEGPG